MSDRASDKQVPLTFTPHEYDRRLTALRGRMKARGIDVLLVFIPENVLYLTGYVTIGFSNFQVLIVPAEGRPLMFIREMERLVAEATTWLDRFDIFSDHQDPLQRLSDVLYENGLASGTLAAEMNGGFVSAALMKKIEARFPMLMDGSNLVEEGRSIKSAEEIALIRRACRITEAGLRAAYDTIAVGATDNMVAGNAYRAMLLDGADFSVTDPIVTTGWRSGVAHTTFTNRELEAGDAILLEFGGCYRRYFGPLMRGAVIGPVERELQRMADVVIESLKSAIAAIRPGATSGEVDEACRRPIEAAGYEPYFRKRTGYSVGSAYAPSWTEGHIISLRQDDPTVLEPGMVFHLPVALRMPRQYGTGFSETVLVTETGCEVLTNFPRKLHVVA